MGFQLKHFADFINAYEGFKMLGIIILFYFFCQSAFNQCKNNVSKNRVKKFFVFRALMSLKLQYIAYLFQEYK